jgi:hypothetical protein
MMDYYFSFLISASFFVASPSKNYSRSFVSFLKLNYEDFLLLELGLCLVRPLSLVSKLFAEVAGHPILFIILLNLYD